MDQATAHLGREGEARAAAHLRRQGYRILSRNYLCPVGELDLVCEDHGAIVFVEVKTRERADLADPEANITRAKRRKLVQVARAWLAAHRHPEAPYRFDAVSVVLSPPSVRHIVDAFVPGR